MGKNYLHNFSMFFVQKLGKEYGFGQKLIVFRPNVG